MAQKNSGRAKTRKERMEARAEQQRLEQLQAQKERRIQTIIGAIVVAIVVAVVAVVGFFAVRNIIESTKSNDQRKSEAYAKVEAVADKPSNATSDGGFVFSKNGVNKPIQGIPTITDYMDFICPGCGVMNRSIDETMIRMVEAGQINFKVHTAGFLDAGSSDRYSTRAAAAVSYVAQNDPEHALKFIQKLFDSKFQPQEGSDYKPVTDEALQQAAIEVGVKEDVAKASTSGTYTKWIEALSEWYPTRSELWNVTGNFKGRMTTPTILINGHYWDLNTITKSAGSNYRALILGAIGIDEKAVGKEGVLPSIGEGTVIDVATTMAIPETPSK